MADFDFQTFVMLAEYLLEELQTQQEPTAAQAQLRAIASRTYYGAYGFLRQRLMTTCNGDCFGKSGLHDVLQELCTQAENDPHLNNIGQKLKRLYSYRIRADYLFAEADAITETDADTAIDAAKQTCKKIGTLQVVQLRPLFLKCDEERDRRRSAARQSRPN